MGEEAGVVVLDPPPLPQGGGWDGAPLDGLYCAVVSVSFCNETQRTVVQILKAVPPLLDTRILGNARWPPGDLC